MSNIKRWKHLSGGGTGNFKYYKFEVSGQILEGKWKGTRVGKYGDNGVVEVDGVEQVFTMSTALRDLVRVTPGSEVRIEYLGKSTAKNGNVFNAFQIFVVDGSEVSDDEPPF